MCLLSIAEKCGKQHGAPGETADDHPGQAVIGSIGVVHVSDVMVPSSIVNNPDGTIVSHVHSDDVHMFKCDTHVLKKKSVCTIDVGSFAIDDMVYSAAL